MEYAELRKDLVACAFDAGKFIEHQIADVRACVSSAPSSSISCVLSHCTSSNLVPTLLLHIIPICATFQVSDIETDVESKMLIIFDGLAKVRAMHALQVTRLCGPCRAH